MRQPSAPWYVENIPGGFVVRDANRKPAAYVYGRDRPRQSEGPPSLLTLDEAREIALSIATLPVFLAMDSSEDSDQHLLPRGRGKVAKRSRFDATPSPHSIPPHPPIPGLNGRAKAKRSDRVTVNQIGV